VISFGAESYSLVLVHHIFHSSTNDYISGFHILSIFSKAAMNWRVQVSISCPLDFKSNSGWRCSSENQKCNPVFESSM
jgi:hypothetical protein